MLYGSVVQLNIGKKLLRAKFNPDERLYFFQSKMSSVGHEEATQWQQPEASI